MIIALLFAAPCMAVENCGADVPTMNNTTFEGVVNWSEVAPLSLDYAAGQIHISERNDIIIKEMIANYHLQNRGHVASFESGVFEQLITANGTFYNVSVKNTNPWNVSCMNVVHFLIDDVETKEIDHIEVFVFYDSKMENIVAITWSHDDKIKTSFVFPSMSSDGGGGECSSAGSSPSGGGGPGGGGSPSGSSAGSEGTASSVSSGDAGGGW